MNTILLLLIFTGLVGLLLVVFFMLDRLNELHKHHDLQKPSIKPDESFGGLSGKALWDAMIGLPAPGWDAKKVALLKPRYEVVLQKHLELLFEDGELDAREGLNMTVKCDRIVPTLRGEIESWIPHEFASGVYRAGHDKGELGPDAYPEIRARLDELGDALFSATGLPPHPLSKVLMPLPREGEEAPAADLPDAAAEGAEGAEGFAAVADGAAPGSAEPAALPPPAEGESLLMPQPLSLAEPETIPAAPAADAEAPKPAA